MNDVIPTITVERSRIANLLEVLSNLAIGEMDAKRVAALLPGGDDELGQVEQVLRRLVEDLAEVLLANDSYTREIEQSAAELEEKLRTIERQQLAIQELSTPVIEVWDSVLTLPIIGVIDTRRSLDMTERLLEAIVRYQARCVIIDVTGVEMVDTATADHFVKMIRAAEMLGTTCVVSGISPAVAQTLTRIGVELAGIRTMRSLKNALQYCLRKLRAPEPVEATPKEPRR